MPGEPRPALISNAFGLPMYQGWAQNNMLPPPNTMLPFQMRPTIMLRIVDRLPKSAREQRGWQKGLRDLKFRRFIRLGPLQKVMYRGFSGARIGPPGELETGWGGAESASGRA